MARISFKLSDQKLNTGGAPGQLSAPMLGGGSGSGRGINPPDIRAPQADPATLPNRQKNVPLIDPQVLNHTANVMIDATMRFADRQADAEAEDALLRANSAANDMFAGVDKDGNGIGYGHKIGKDAIDTYEDFSKGIDAVYEHYMPAGDLARSKYLNKAFQYRERARNAGADHRVKQQEVYEGGQRYARAQQLVEDFQTYGETVFQPGPDGLSQFEKALQGYKTPEEMDQVRSSLYKNIVNTMLAKVDDADATKELGKLKLVKDFNDRYSTFNSPLKRADVDTVINSGIVAAQKRMKYEYKENMAKLRASDLAQAPTAMFSSIQNGDMKGVLSTLDTMKRGYSQEDADQYETDAGQAMKEMVRTAFFVGNRNTAQIEEQLNALSSMATEQGTPLSPHLEYSAKVALEELKGTERAMKTRENKVAYNSVLLGAYDENGVFDIQKAKELAGKTNLDTMYKVKLQERLNLEQRRKATADLKRSTGVQDIQFAALKLGLEVDGTAGRTIEEFQEEMEAKVQLGEISEKQALSATSEFVKTVRREEKEGMSDPDLKLIREEIKGYAQAKMFTGKQSDNPENVLLNKQAAARLIRNVEAWRRANPKGDLQGYWSQQLEGMKKTSFFGSESLSGQGIPTFENSQASRFQPQSTPEEDNEQMAELEKTALPLPPDIVARLKSKGNYMKYLQYTPKQQQAFIDKYVKKVE